MTNLLLALISLAIAAYFLAKAFGGRADKEPVALINGDGSYSFDIVGEGYRQDALERLAGGREDESADVDKVAFLVPEPHNLHDKNAVMIVIDGAHVGYLARADAAAYRAQFGRRILAANAKIVGGWDRGSRGKGHFGVKLDIAGGFTQ